MAKVVKFKSSNVVSYTGDEIIEGLRTELYKYMRTGGKLKDISEKCGGYPTVHTISNFAYGITTRPRFVTVMLIFKAMGFTITVTNQ